MKSLGSLCRLAAATALLFALNAPASAQLRTPAASPYSLLKQTVGLTEIEIEYSRPSKKGREIFGGLVPYGEVWRTGANQPTKITFSDDVTLGGKPVPAGTYALYTIPGADEWTVIVYKSTELWGAFGYDKSNDLVRFTAKPTRLEREVESFTVGVGKLRIGSAELYLEWDATRVAIPLEVPTDSKVMSQIDALQGTESFENPNVLFAAGTYYHESGKDLNSAHEWVSKACEKSENPAFWMFARKASIEADLGMNEAAKASAEKTLELATAANNSDYQKIAREILASL